jgi:hypothetical protein
MWQCCKAMVNNSLIQPVAFPLVIAGFLTRRLAQTMRAVTAIWLGDGHLGHGLDLE